MCIRDRAETGRDHLAEDGSSEDEHRESGDRSGGMPDDAGEPNTDDGDQAGGHRTEDEGLKGTGMAECDLDVLARQDALAKLEADDIAHQGPVSYTHLDVYKRQGHTRGGADRENQPLLTAPDFCRVDVYKRQTLIITVKAAWPTANGAVPGA